MAKEVICTRIRKSREMKLHFDVHNEQLAFDNGGAPHNTFEYISYIYIYVFTGLFLIHESDHRLLLCSSQTDGIRGRLPSRVRGGAQPQLVRARAQGESTQRVFYGDPAPEPGAFNSL
ncbi:hypothetical protein GQ600_14546 [Phytophthora cactorum]|nr:hypothetical protein GQ600_14546 [Phytophthora cactorum]